MEFSLRKKSLLNFLYKSFFRKKLGDLLLFLSVI